MAGTGADHFLAENPCVYSEGIKRHYIHLDVKRGFNSFLHMLFYLVGINSRSKGIKFYLG